MAWITNTTADSSNAVIFDTTRLVDTAGDQYKPSLVQDIQRSKRDNAPLSLVKDVPIKISVTFMDVPTSVQNIALFEILVGGSVKGQFRNIKITELKTSNSSFPIKKKR